MPSVLHRRGRSPPRLAMLMGIIVLLSLCLLHLLQRPFVERVCPSVWKTEREKTFQEYMSVHAGLVERLRRRDFSELIHMNAVMDATQSVCVPAYWHRDLPWPWFIYRPHWTCPMEQRLGEVFDGGKWVCNVRRLAQEPHCVAYSFGSDNKTVFERELHRRTGCEVHIFDPTVSLDVEALGPGVYFHPWGLSHMDGTFSIDEKGLFQGYTLESIAAQLHHTHIHLVKMDVDGAEWRVFQDGVPAFFHYVDEILIELHWAGLDEAINLMESLLRVSFRIFHSEPNLFYYQHPSAGIEYSLVRPGIDMLGYDT